MSGPAPAPATLSARTLRRRFGHRLAVDGVDLDVHSGEIVGLLGPNGAGKTVTFYMLVGLLRPTGGQVLLDGDDITGLAMHERARRGLAYLPQERSIFRGLSTRDNVAAVLECRGVARREARRRADAVLGDFGLASLARVDAARLSGGEQRRLEVARAVALEPRILLLDEPFAGIDPITVEMIHGLLVGLRERGIGILITDHNVREALLLSRARTCSSTGTCSRRVRRRSCCAMRTCAAASWARSTHSAARDGRRTPRTRPQRSVRARGALPDRLTRGGGSARQTARESVDSVHSAFERGMTCTHAT